MRISSPINHAQASTKSQRDLTSDQLTYQFNSKGYATNVNRLELSFEEGMLPSDPVSEEAPKLDFDYNLEKYPMLPPGVQKESLLPKRLEQEIIALEEEISE